VPSGGSLPRCTGNSRRRLEPFRTEIAGLRAELRTEIAGLRVEFRTELQQVRTELLRWMFGFWVTTLLGIAGLLIALRGQ
jgi:hypothetical protein